MLLAQSPCLDRKEVDALESLIGKVTEPAEDVKQTLLSVLLYFKQPAKQIIEHAATLQYLFQKGEGGMSPYQGVKGKEWTIALPAIGETIDYKHNTRHKLEMRWDRGIFLGIRIDRTDSWNGQRHLRSALYPAGAGGRKI